MANSTKIHIMGAAAVIVSGVKLEDWKLVENNAPEALKIMNEDGEPVFRVMTSYGPGSVNHYGIVWGSYTSDEGNATVTVLLAEDLEDRKATLMKVAGPALLALEGIESSLPGIIGDIRGRLQKIEERVESV